MSSDINSASINGNDLSEQKAAAVGIQDADEQVLQPEAYHILDTIQRRVLWLCTLMIHHANNVRPTIDDLKVGGHQASSASMVSILTALYFHFLDEGDRLKRLFRRRAGRCWK